MRSLGGAALCVVFVAFVLAGCGSDKQSASTESATPIEEAKAPAAAESQGSQSPSGAKASSRGDTKSVRQDEEEEASDFVPKHHQDSGGGSEQFREPKGGDNSVQDYGEESETSELDEAAAAMHGYFDARAAANWAASCTYLSKGAIEQAEKLAEYNGQKPKGQGCAAVMEAIWSSVLDSLLQEEAKEADAGSLRIEDDHAFLIYKGLEGKRELLQMDKEDGHWKVAALEGFAF
jgi:hypothetical protein